MVDENLTLAEKATRQRRETFEDRQQFEMEKEQMQRATAPAPSVQQADQVIDVPPPEVTPAPAPEADPYFQTQETDPELVQNALNENPVIREANRMIYGDAVIAQTMKARDSGNLDITKATIQPLPAMQLMMSSSGQSAMTLALYMYGQTDPVFLENLRNKIGSVAFFATANAVKTHQGAENVQTIEEKGLFSRVLGVGNDVSGLVTKLDAPEAVAAGGMMFLGAVSDLANQVPTIPGIIIAADQALGGQLPERTIQGLQENIESAERMEEAQREFIQGGEDFFVDRLDTVTGQIAAGFSEFAFGWVGAPLKIAKGAGLAANIANASLRGAVVDNVIYDNGDGNLTSMLVELGVLETNVIVDLLSPDMDDSMVERRLAVTLEGLALGIGIDALIGGVVRGIRAGNKGDVAKAAKEFDKALTGSMEEANKANKAVVDDINDRAEKYFRELEPEAPGTSDPVDTLEFNRIVNLNKDVDNPMLDNFAKYAKIQGRANDADLSLINELTNIEDLKAKVITEDVADLKKVIADRAKGVFGKIQEPKSRAMVAAISSKIIERHGFEFMDADLQDAFKADVSKWSDEQSANLMAAATLEDMLQEQYFQVITEMDSALTNGSFNKELFPGANDIDDLRLIRQKIMAQRAILRTGRAKIANQAGRALRITRMLGKQDQAEEYAKQKAAWKRDLGLIDDKQEIALIKSILTNAKDKSTREITKTLDDISVPRGLEKWLRVSNANLLTGIGTQALMVGSNVARVLSEGLFRGIQGVILEPATAIRYWGNKELREQALTRASQQTRQAYMWYAAIFTNLPKMNKALARYFDTGVSNFNQRTYVDEDNPFAGKTLKEIMKDDQGLKLLGRSEYLYRWMGGVDEAFKELVVSADQQIRAATGEWGPGMEKPWYKVTQDDVNKIMETNPDAVPGLGERLSDVDSVERAKEIMFQFEPEKGTLRGMIQGQLTKKNKYALVARMLGMRFVSTPLAVMEQRFANQLAPIALALDAMGRTEGAANMNFLMGKFAGDLRSNRIEVRQRARAVLLTNSLIGSMAITYYLSGQEWVNLDSSSKDYMKIRSPLEPEGSKRWFNVVDAESPINAFIMWTALLDHIVRANDPTDATSSMDVASAMVTLFIDETLEKSSLGNMMDTLSSLADPDPRKLERFLIQQATPFNPFGWYQRKALGWVQNSQGTGFDGRPTDLTERLGKAIPTFQLIFGGVSNRLRNPLGELINPTNGIIPFASPTRLDDPVMQELELIQEATGEDFIRDQFSTLGIDYALQPWSKGQSVYDRAQHLISQGDIKLGGYTLREAMEILINSEEYKNDYDALVLDLEKNPTVSGSGDKRAKFFRDPRVTKVRELLDLFRKSAVDEAIRTLDQDYLDQISDAQDARTRDADSIRSVYQSQN